MRTSVFSLLLLSGALSVGFAYDFPTGFGRVDQAYGDFDTSGYHAGVDLPGYTGQEVKSPIPFGRIVLSDVSRPSKGFVCVQDTTTLNVYAFGHIKPTAFILAVDTWTIIGQGTLLGTLDEFPDNPTGNPQIAQYPHLHIAASTRSDKLCAKSGMGSGLEI